MRGSDGADVTCSVHWPSGATRQSAAGIIPTHLWKALRFSSMLCLVGVFRWPSIWCEHRTRSQTAGPEEAPSATLAALREEESIQPAKTDAHTPRCIKTHLPPSRQSSERRPQLSFGLYTCTSLHRSPPLQTGSKACQSCQILSLAPASLPFSSTSLLEWDYNEKHGHFYCQTNYTTVSGVKKPNFYIQSPRYALQLQKLSFQHHLLCLDTRGQQHAGHSHWGGFWRWECKNYHIIWRSNVSKLSGCWCTNVSLLYHQIHSQLSYCSQNTHEKIHMYSCDSRKMLLNPASQERNKATEHDERGMQVCRTMYANTFKEIL